MGVKQDKSTGLEKRWVMKDVKGSEADIPKLRQFRRENDKMCDELNFSISSDDIKLGGD